jgi:uncharacterized membrane protein YozB (DUF420 family)
MTFGFPEINASLNAVAFLLLVAGYLAIRGRWIRLHIACMIAALAVSTVFLGCYLWYHIVVKGGKSTTFAEQAPAAPEWAASVYYVVLVSHILLAMAVVPLALTTTYRGLRNQLDRHVRVAWWTLPIWLYVSITGVVVYWMLYRLYAAS